MKKSILLFTFLSLTTLSASARVFSVRSTLNITNGSPASGTLTGTLDDETGVFNYTLSVINTGPSDPMNGHSFRLGADPFDPILFQISSANNPYNGTVTSSNLDISEVKAGNFYITANLGEFGESVSGQITIGMEIFNHAARNDFYGIGGYSHTDDYIPDGRQSSPYVWSGPSPQNDFMYAATTPNGTDLYGSLGRLSTFVFNTAITLAFKGNNVRKLGLKVYEEDFSGALTNGSINATITTNLGNTATLTSTDGARFVGFRVLNQDEFIVSATFSANAGLFTSLDEIMFGDDTPQNVSLNFDGVDDYVEIPSSVGNFAFNQNFTVTTWVKIPSANQPNTLNIDNDILEKWSLVGGYPFVIRYFNHTASAGNRFKINVARWDGANNPNMFSTINLNDEQWHHIAFVKNGTTLTLYIDGLQNNTTTDNTTGTTTNSSALYVGSRGNNTNYFKGEIDEVRIWGIAKTATEIDNERFCKTPNGLGLFNSFNFSNGVPHDNNPLITQVQDAVSTNHGTLNNFAKNGDASNFVTGQVKYVNANSFLGSNNGSSWANAFLNLLSALPANTCNDLFDVYVAKNSVAYRPSFNFDVNASFIIPSGMSIYGGFAGTEKSINQRNRALIQTTNETTLSGDLNSNDILSDFNQNRSDNSRTVVNMFSKSNIIIDGFSIRGGFGGGYGGGVFANSSQNIRISHCKIFDNSSIFGGGIGASGANNLLITNTYLLGNRAIGTGHAIYFDSNNGTKNMKLNNCIVSGHTGNAIEATGGENPQTFGIINHSYTNCTFANNGTAIRNQAYSLGTNNFTLKNSIMYGNTTGINYDGIDGTYNQNITYSLVQGITTGTGNLDGNTTNPQFVNPIYTNPNNAGDYRLKWCSKAINAGDNAGISPLDLDRNPRNFNGTTDMGAFEFLGNTPSQVNNSTITGTIDSPTYAGGAIQTITSAAKILAPADAIDFKAPNSITLNPGFEARGMSNYFQAQIGANVGCVNP
jgi:hypothetical protein